VLANEGFRDKLFIATKLEAPDAAELKRSLSRLNTAKLDLLQLHNVRNRRQSLAQFKAWKAQGVCRYVGVISPFHGDFPAMEAVIAREQPDFVQIDYSLGDREAQKRILALAAEIKAGVLTAQPFGSGRLSSAPCAAGRFLTGLRTSPGSWAQFFLKYLLGDERVTAVIPGTSNPVHTADNLGAMRGRVPDSDQRNRMVAFVDSL
jgi:aryl-alcohol dehydrogenase-like predicted oxidoreductase